MSRPPHRRRWRFTRAVAVTLATIALGGWLAVHLMISWISSHPAVAAVVLVAGGGISYVGTRPETPRIPALTRPAVFLALSAGEFEEAVADLCRRDGCRDVQVVGGAGDLAADVLATTPDGRRILVQCKRYAPARRVGSPEVQRVGGTYQVVHRAELAIVVTTASYTEAAAEYAAAAGIRLVDGDELVAWASGAALPPWGGERRMQA